MDRRTFAKLGLAFLLAGCAPPPAQPQPTVTQQPNTQPTAPSQPPPTAAPLPTPAGPPGTQTQSSSFAAYQPVPVSFKPSVPDYTIPANFDGIAFSDIIRVLNADQKVLLAQNGFVVVPDNYTQPYNVYKHVSNSGIFITTDVMLHAFHIIYDYTLRVVEIDKLYDQLVKLNTALLAAAQQQGSAANGAVKEAALRDVAFFAVAAKLLDDKAQVPGSVAQKVNAELALIAAHQGIAPSPIFGYKEDYSQYVPRGHYTRNAQFQRYFKAMMWYGRMTFRLRPGDSPQDIAEGRSETLSALLIVSALNGTDAAGEPAAKRWEAIYEPTTFFVGSADDLTVEDYTMLMQQVYNSKTPAPAALEDSAKLDEFINRARTLRPPSINSGVVSRDENIAAVTQGFRMMGQRYIPDSYILQQLVDPQVPNRTMPKGLDVPAVLGSDRALEILLQVFKENKYDRYEAQVKKLRAEFAGLNAATWNQNLYWNWLYSLLPMLGKGYGEGYPKFMRNSAWLDRQLFTVLGSWAELRHDTILYAKQSATATGAMPPPQQPPPVYVEPQPEVFARLAALANQMRTGLTSRGLLPQEFSNKLQSFERLATQLKTVAELELNNQPVPKQDSDSLRNIGSSLESLTTVSQQTGNAITSEADDQMAVIADVHTDPNSNSVLEVGVGNAFVIYVIVPVGNGLAVTRGAHFSYYEFTQPMSNRLTDEAWQKMNPKPPFQPWTSSFLK